MSVLPLTASATVLTDLDQLGGKPIALLGDRLELLNEVLRILLGGLDRCNSASTKSRVDFSGLVEDLVQHRLGVLDEREDTLNVSYVGPC